MNSLADKTIYVAGHRGMVGSAVLQKLKLLGVEKIHLKTSAELDLCNQAATDAFFASAKPDIVVFAAARVGGIHANSTYPANFLYDNLSMATNSIHAAYVNGCERFLFLGSTCIYPKEVEQPMLEEAILTDILEPTNEPYALAKIAGIKLCESYNRQHGTDFRSVMPTNLYGINDNFHSQNSHVIPALMRRFHEAKLNKDDEVIVWGTGNAMREFMYVDDMAEACIFILELDKKIYDNNTRPMQSHINIGTGKDTTIREMATIMKKVVGFKGEIVFDDTKPDGTPRKLINVSRISKMGWSYTTELEDGLEKTYKWYLHN